MLSSELVSQSWLAQGAGHEIPAHPVTGLVATATATSMVWQGLGPEDKEEAQMIFV